MLFTSIVFLILFLPFVFLANFLLHRDSRNFFIFIASLFFYFWGEAQYIVILLFSIGFNFFLTYAMAHAPSGVKRKSLLTIAVAVNLGLLIWFKYANFIVENINSISTALHGPSIQLSPVYLPIGISFFTFQALSYVIDVYRGELSVQKRFVNLALYISLFPQLLSGPIVRYRDIASEMHERSVNIERFAYGVRRLIIGLGKKMILANPVGQVADTIFSLPPGQLSTALTWLGVISYTLQIYLDFSGYSDMAIGLARMLGFTYPENFNYPYISQSIREFWQRWHISLSSWFRDYLYIPLGGNRTSRLRTLLNLWIVFIVCGLWHGASWNFVVWGAIHGFFMVLERLGLEQHVLQKAWRPFRHLYMLLVVMVAWVFFRTETINGAFFYLSVMFGIKSGVPTINIVLDLFSKERQLVLTAGMLAVLPWRSIYHAMKDCLSTRIPNSLLSTPNHWGPYISFGRETAHGLIMIWIFILSLMNVATGTYKSFIYFRF